jgi:hypothetical protein
VLLYLVKVGSLGGSETSIIGIYGNSDLTAAIATSSAFTVADAPNVSSSAWRGWIAHTFAADVPLANDTWYHLGLSLANYTRNGDTFYIAAQLDDERHYMPAYGSRVTAAKFRLIGER